MNQYFRIYRLIFREFIVYTLIFTALGLNIYIKLGWSGAIYIFWIKVIGLASIAVAYQFYKSRHFVFFYNLGLSLSKLLFIVVASDLLLLMISIGIASYFV